MLGTALGLDIVSGKSPPEVPKSFCCVDAETVLAVRVNTETIIKPHNSRLFDLTVNNDSLRLGMVIRSNTSLRYSPRIDGC